MADGGFDPNAAPALFAGIFGCFSILFYLIFAALYAWLFARIFSKAGYSWALGLLMLVPIVNFIVPLIFAFVLAFGDWPVLGDLRRFKQQQAPRTP